MTITLRSLARWMNAAICVWLTFPLFTGIAATAQSARVSNSHGLAPSLVDGIVISPVPTGPTAVIDTTMGRITCKLYEKEAPVAVANFIGLAEGTKDWTDPVTNQKMHGKRFYDGTVFSASSGVYIVGGDRLGNRKGTAGYTFPSEIDYDLKFNVPGRLAMVDATPDTNSSQFMITGKPLPTQDGKAPIFGQCDEASIRMPADITHHILATDDDPQQLVVINRITIVRKGQPLPRVAANVKPIIPPGIKRPASVPFLEPTGPTVHIDTSMGRITCKLYTKEAPVTTGVFIGLAEGTRDWTDPITKKTMHGVRYYDGLTFHRVNPDFLAQGGAPRGGQGPGFKYKDEPNPSIPFDRPGRLAMANSGPGTNGSQFYVTEHAVRRLYGYTIFGQCDDASVKLVEQIDRVRRDAKDKPLDAVVIRRIDILNDGERPAAD